MGEIMNFKDFEAKFVKENRLLWIVLIASFVVSSITLAVVTWNERVFVFSGGEIFKERPLIEHICKRGFESIVEGHPHSYFVTTGIIDLLKKEGEFLVKIKEILILKSSDVGKCKIILKDNKRLRAFVVGVASSNNFPFFYKVNQIDELDPSERGLL